MARRQKNQSRFDMLREKAKAFHPFITFKNGRPFVCDLRMTAEALESRTMENHKPRTRTHIFGKRNASGKWLSNCIPHDLDGVHRADRRLDRKTVW